MIESKQNKIVKYIKSLSNKKNRDDENVFVVEGERFVSLINEDVEVKYIIVSQSYLQSNDNICNQNDLVIVTDEVFEYIAETVKPQGIMAVCRKQKYNLNDILKQDGTIIVCENMQDPNNAGTVIRTADSTGCICVVFTNNSVDIYNSKVVRGTAGSIFNIPVVYGYDSLEIIKLLKENGFVSYGTHLNTNNYYDDVTYENKTAIFIGNEGNGLLDSTAMSVDKLVKIPMLGKSESLNASVASSVILYEIVRQRRKK